MVVHCGNESSRTGIEKSAPLMTYVGVLPPCEDKNARIIIAATYDPPPIRVLGHSETVDTNNCFQTCRGNCL